MRSGGWDDEGSFGNLLGVQMKIALRSRDNSLFTPKTEMKDIESA